MSYSDLVHQSQLIIIPVNCGNVHWILLVIDMSEEVIRIYDSLKVWVSIMTSIC